MTWTWDEIETKATPPEVSVSICMRGDLVAEHERLEGDLRRARDDDARENRTPLAEGIAQQIQDLEKEMRAAEARFTFRGIGRRQFTDLIAAHPPTTAQQEQAGDMDLPYNLDTYPAALVAASCVEPEGITIERARAVADGWTLGQWSLLWRACLAANQGSAEVGPKSVLASLVLNGSEQS